MPTRRGVIRVSRAQGKEMLHLVGYPSEDRLRDAAQQVIPLQCASRDLDALPGATAPAQNSACGLHQAC